jgi:abortive infection bacteriophage resistance protein
VAGFRLKGGTMTKYTKKPLDFDNQAKLLIQRGIIADKNELSSFLGKVNYYRFAGYLYPFRMKNSDNFIKGTTFQKIRNIYFFDSKLRLLTFSAIETIDIAILRTQMVEEFSMQNGPFCYTKQKNYKIGYSINDHRFLMRNINKYISRSSEEFVENYKNKYTSEKYLPIWMIAELSTFGLLSRMFENLPPALQVPIAKKYNLHSRELISWLHSLSTIRNICAHHSRLWNRALPIRPSIPNKKYHPEFHSPTKINNFNYFIILAILKYFLDIIEPDNSLMDDFNNLIIKFPDVPLYKMGFPPNWKGFKIFH